jgi:hypothetical protein
MTSWNPKSSSFIEPLGVIALFSFVMGCGAVGGPIAPEDVGIATKVRKQQQKNAQQEETLSKDETISIEEKSVELPLFYPIGTR